MNAGIVGPTAEQQLVTGLFEDSAPALRALVIEGDAGMGKTTLWAHGVEAANKAGAATLFVTVRTVEGNLTRIYRKLGVQSRTELAALLLRESNESSA